MRSSRNGQTGSLAANYRSTSPNGQRVSSATWSTRCGIGPRPSRYQHDAISTDKRNPHINANGLIYGSSEESTDLVPTLDPIKHIAGDDQAPLSRPQDALVDRCAAGTSAYWGDEPIWDGHTSIHNVMMDEQGKVWFTARLRPTAKSRLLQAGSDLASAKVAPQATSLRQLSRFDPATGKWDLINTCFTTHHFILMMHEPDAVDQRWRSRPRRRHSRLAEHQAVSRDAGRCEVAGLDAADYRHQRQR